MSLSYVGLLRDPSRVIAAVTTRTFSIANLVGKTVLAFTGRGHGPSTAYQGDKRVTALWSNLNL